MNKVKVDSGMNGRTVIHPFSTDDRGQIAKLELVIRPSTPATRLVELERVFEERQLCCLNDTFIGHAEDACMTLCRHRAMQLPSPAPGPEGLGGTATDSLDRKSVV